MLKNSITNLQLSSGIIKNNNANVQNTTVITNYVDGTDVNVINNNNSTPDYNTITGFNVAATGSTYDDTYAYIHIIHTHVHNTY